MHLARIDEHEVALRDGVPPQSVAAIVLAAADKPDAHVIMTVGRKREVRERRLDADHATSSGPVRDELVGHEDVPTQRTATDARASNGTLRRKILRPHDPNERSCPGRNQDRAKNRAGHDGSRVVIGQTRAGRYLRVICVADPLPEEEEALAEDEAATENTTDTVMTVPKPLVPAVRELIAKHEREAGGRRR